MTFLSAEWRNLIMANYAVEPALLRPYLPCGLELDLYEHTCYVSLVGFMFLNTRIFGVPVPFHIDFEEINLRFYVRKQVAGQWRRGTVFIKEIVSRPAITLVARGLYREPYQTMPTRHAWSVKDGQKHVSYSWKHRGLWQNFSVEAGEQALPMEAGGREEFITEHYYGYTRWNGRVTKEYEVRHPRWLVHPVTSYRVEVDFGALYGAEFRFLNGEAPGSVLLAEGSKVQVMGNQEAG